MKNFLIVLIVLAVLGGAGYYGYQYLAKPAFPTQATEESTGSQTDTVRGLLLPGKGDDYSYILRADNGKTIGIASQKIDLSQYSGKSVEITGSYSGTTLYAYTVTEVQ
jgi:uncharacterized protein (UPF0333 family)